MSKQIKNKLDLDTAVNLSRAVKNLNLEINEHVLNCLKKIHRKNIAKHPNESIIIGQAIIQKLYKSDKSIYD